MIKMFKNKMKIIIKINKKRIKMIMNWSFKKNLISIILKFTTLIKMKIISLYVFQIIK